MLVNNHQAADPSQREVDALNRESSKNSKSVQAIAGATPEESLKGGHQRSIPAPNIEGIDAETTLLALLAKLEELTKDRSLNQLEDQQKAQEQQDKKRINEMVERLKSIREAEKWGAMGKVMNYVLGGLMVLGGALLIATGAGAPLGVGLMVGGAIAITDQALQDTGTLEGGFAGALADAFISAGMDPATAQIMGMVTYVLLSIMLSAGAGLAAGGKTAVMGAINGVKSLPGAAVNGVKSLPGAVSNGVSAAAHTLKSLPQAVLTFMKDTARVIVSLMQNIKHMKASSFSLGDDALKSGLHKIANTPTAQKVKMAETGVITSTGLASASINFKAGEATSDALQHEALATEIAAIIEAIAMKMQLTREDVQEAFEAINDVTSLIMNIIQGNKDTANELAVLTTKV